MTLTHLKNKFKVTLKTIYPLSDVTSIFRLLVNYKLDLDAAEIVLEASKALSERDLEFFHSALNRLQDKEPVQYILGETNFYSLNFKVTPDVLIPRPETEELVEWIIQDATIQIDNKKIRILDIGAGSGCIAISLANNLPYATVSALDISEKALQIAKENAQHNKVDIHFIQADILKIATLPQRYDIIVSNPPYVREEEKMQMHENVLEHEPKEALFVSDETPLLFYDKIADLAKKHLSEKGCLYFEINQYLGKETLQLMKAKGFTSVELRKDFLGKNRFIKACK